MRKHDRSDYRHEDYFDEHGNYRDPAQHPHEPREKGDGETRGPWVN